MYAIYTSGSTAKDTPLARGEEGYIQLLKLEAPSPSVKHHGKRFMVSTARPFRPFFFFNTFSFLSSFLSSFFFPLYTVYSSLLHRSPPRDFSIAVPAWNRRSPEKKDDTFSGKRPPFFEAATFVPLFFSPFLLAKESEDRYREAIPSFLSLLPRVLFQSVASTKFVVASQKNRGGTSPPG